MDKKKLMETYDEILAHNYVVYSKKSAKINRRTVEKQLLKFLAGGSEFDS